MLLSLKIFVDGTPIMKVSMRFLGCTCIQTLSPHVSVDVLEKAAVRTADDERSPVECSVCSGVVYAAQEALVAT